MLLGDIYNILREGELKAKSNEITAYSDKAIAYSLNLGIIELIKRFPICYKEIILELDENKPTYLLPPDCTTIVAVYDYMGMPTGINQSGWERSIFVRDKFHIDASALNLGREIQLIYKPSPVYRNWTNKTLLNQTNTDNITKSTPISATKVGNIVTEGYQLFKSSSLVDKISYEFEEDYNLYSIDPKHIIGEQQLELAIPESLIEALCTYVGWRVAEGTITTNPKESTFHYQLFEQSCMRVQMDNAVTPEGVYAEMLYNLQRKGYDTFTRTSPILAGDM
jgi:hypothetical protein